MKWTKMQEKAVTSPVNDILVTAAAGSGKTQVLTGRILNRITNEKADISRMLVITFTNAAAAEMRSRISKKISEASALDPRNKHLRRQLALIGSSDISTIHSFCLKVLRSYFYIPDIDPTFKMAETYDVNIMMAEALSDAMDYFYESEDEDFLSTIELLCGAKNDFTVSTMVEKLWRFAQSDPFPEKWLIDAQKKYMSLSDNFSFYTEILEKKAVFKLKTAYENAKASVELSEVTPGLERHYSAYLTDLEYLSSALKGPLDWDNLNLALKYKFSRSPGGKCSADPFIKEKCKQFHDTAKDAFNEAAEYISMPYSEALECSTAMQKTVCTLISVTKKAMELYNEKKREKNVLDFDDLEHLTIQILTKEDENGNIIPSDAALEIRDRYDEIYVDEYQDTNDVQETILKMISSESKGCPNLFMVGDMKQSIYKFRMTNPKKIFGEKAAAFKDVSEKEENDRHIKIALSQNFRSRAEILESVNSVFDLLMSETAGEVDYTGTERLSCGSTYYTEPLALPAFRLSILAQKAGLSSSDCVSLQAYHIASRIKTLMSSGIKVYDKEISDFRPLSYKDIALLLRAPGTHAAYFEDILTSNNIPVYSDIDSAFFDCSEIQILLALLRIIDNPLQDISLICVLRSPIFHFNENLLALLALKKKDYLYEAIKEAAYSSENPDKKCLYFITRLQKWRNEASFMSVSDFLSMLIRDTHFSTYVSAMPDSEAHLSNINLLLTMAKKSDESSYKGLFNFLQYIDKMYLSGESTVAATLSDSLDAVRIMSIHKSKGLEFPVVFLGCAEHPFSNRDYSGDLLLHKDLGIGLNAFTEDRLKFHLPLNKAISETIKDECVSEELRILYVALTRAREHLEVVGLKKLGKEEDHYLLPEREKIISPEKVLSCKSYLDWLIMAATDNDLISINIINNPSFEETLKKETQITVPEPTSCTEDISSVLEYLYPYSHLKSVKNKYSVSELKAANYNNDENPSTPAISAVRYTPSLKKPAFLNSDKVFTSAQKGSIMHYVMQKLDFKNEDIENQLSSMNLTEEEYKAVDLKLLTTFLHSDLGQRMKKADPLHREEAFTFYKNLSEITEKNSDNANVLIQGIIDCYFIEDDGIILLDYKTDKNITAKTLKERYHTQLDIYSEALEKRYNLPVKEKLIYSFYLNEVIHI